MSALGLFFVGAVLLINGLSVLGRVSMQAAAPINAFVGSFLLIIVLSADLPRQNLALIPGQNRVIQMVGFLLFAFTYLYVAILDWTSHDNSGLGWYCGWACLVSIALSAAYFVRLHDGRFGAIWLSWAVLFGFFFALNVPRSERARQAAGWYTVIVAFTTCTIPGGLELLGKWGSTSTAGVIAVQAIVVALGIYLVVRRATGSSEARQRQSLLEG